MFKLEFDTTGGAFAEGREYSVSQLLHGVAASIENGRTSGKVMDSWGVSHGEWTLSFPDYDES